MPDFNGLDPIIADQKTPQLTPIYNPSPSPATISTPAENKPVADTEDLADYYSKNSDFKSKDIILSQGQTYENKKYGGLNPTISNPEDYARWGQSGWSRIGNAADNLVEKTGSYLVQTAGFIGGAVGALGEAAANITSEYTGTEKPFVNPISAMTDNFLTKLADTWKENVQERSPIYKSDRYTNGNIWQKLSTTDWWLDDAIDRVALTAAMVVPGFLEAKGIGLFGAVTDATGALKATGVAAKGIQALGEDPELYGELGKRLGSQIYKTASEGTIDIGTGSILADRAIAFKNAIQTAQKVELYTWNTIGQSALNGREAQVAIRKELLNQKAQGLNNLSIDEINDRAAEGAAQGFWYTVPLSLAGSLYELPQIFSSAKMAESSLKKFFNPETLDMVEGAMTKSVRPSTGKWLGKVFLTGLEHGQNESAQVAAGRYIEESIAGKTVDKNGQKVVQADERNPFLGMFQNWIDNVNDPNGQNNIALGTIQGMLLSGWGHGKSVIRGEYAAQDKANRDFITSINTATAARRYWTSPNDLIEKNDDGSPVMIKNPDGKDVPKFNMQKLADMGVSLVDGAKDYQERVDAIANGDRHKIQELNFKSLASLSQNFFDDPKGMDYLTNLLRFEAKNQNDNIKRVNDSQNGIEVSPDVQLQDNLQYIQTLKKAYDAIDQRHAGFTRLDIDKTNKTDIRAARDYTEKVKNAEYQNAASQIYLNSAIQKNNIVLTSFGPLDTLAGTPQEEQANSIIEENKSLQQNLDNAKSEYKNLVDREQFRSNFLLYKQGLAKDATRVEEVQSQPTEEPKSIITIPTARGDKDLEIGTPYFLGRNVQYNKEGLNDYIPISKLTILGENSDGTIKIEDEDGNVRSISKETLADYNLGKVDTLKSDKTANYFFKYRNNKFTYNFGKDYGGVKEGRLEYNNGKLYFKYLDSKGDVVAKEVNKEHFEKQGKFDKARITRTDEKVETPEQIKAREEFLAQKVNEKKQVLVEQSKQARTDIILKIKSDIDENLKKVTADLLRKKDVLSRIQDDIKQSQSLKKGQKVEGKFSKILKNTNSAITSLKDERTKTEAKIDELTGQISDLELDRSYFEDFLNNSDVAESTKDAVEELRQQIQSLDDLSDQLNNTVKELSQLRDDITKAIKSAVQRLKDAVNTMDKDYPDPLKNVMDSIINTDDVLSNIPMLKEQLSDYTLLLPDLQMQITEDSDTLTNLDDRIQKVVEGISELQNSYKNTQKIIDRFKQLANDEDRRITEANKILEQTNVITGSFSDGIAPNHENVYEAANKKSDHNLINGTKPNSNNTPEQKRTDKFGILWNKLDDSQRSKFKTIDVTQATEEQIGLKGLMKHLLTDEAMATPGNESYKRENIIARVIVSDKGNLIDKEGNELSPDQLLDPLNHALFQVLPEPINGKLVAKYNGKTESSFRESTKPLIRENLEQQFAARRLAILANTDLQPLQDFDSSFGSPIYEYVLDENGQPKIDKKTNKPIINYDARTSVEDAKVIDSELLKSAKIVDVVTINGEVSEGSVSMNMDEGSTILRIPGSGLIKLFSRKLNAKEANTTFDVLVQLTKELQNKDNTIAQKTLFNWLKSVVYWGIMKDSNSNVWFANIKNEQGEKVPTLFIKRKDGTPFSTTFTTDDLLSNKTSVVNELQNIYHNVDAKLTSDAEYNNKYNEITGIKEDGTPIIDTWNNYQTYLLSNKNNDGKGTRTDIPLTTPLKPIKYEGDINRKDFYFTIKGDVDAVIHSTVTPEALLKSAPLSPLGAKKQTPTEKVEEKIPTAKVPAEIPSDKFDLGGEKANTIKMFAGTETVSFAADKSTYQRIENPITKEIEPSVAIDASIKSFPDNQKVIDRIVKDFNKTEEQSISILHAKIVKDVLVQIEADKIIPQLEAPVVETPKIGIDKTDPFFTPDDIPDNAVFREKLVDSAKRFSPENWSKFEEFLKDKFPNIPTYRVKNVIQRTNGKQAWGMFKDGAIYIVENAQIGTGYHEVFEAVWGMFATIEEKTNVLKEFRNSKGTYTDRFTGKEVNPSITDPSDAKYVSDDQIKEEIAEEFSDLMVDGKEPVRNNERSLIGKLFHDLINFIKTFFTGKDAVTNTQELFNKIGEGYYKEFIPYQTDLSFAKSGVLDVDSADPTGTDVHFKDKKAIPANQMNDIIQHFNYMTIATLLRNGEDIFNIDTLSKDDLYAMLKEDILKRVKNISSLLLKGQDLNNLPEGTIRKVNNARDLYYNIIEDWKNIVKTHIEYLKGKNIIFNENEIAVLNENNEDGVDKADYIDSNKIDSFKQMDSSVKLLLGTLPLVNPDGTFIASTVGGVICLPADQVNINLLNALSDSTSPDDMFVKLGEYGKTHPNYKVLFNRIIGTPYTSDSIDYSQVNKTKLQIISEFWKSFNKQTPEALTLFVLPTGESVISDTAIKGASEVINRDMINNIIHTIKKGTKYFNYNAKTGMYTPSDVLKKTPLSGDVDNFIDFLNTLGVDFKSYKKYLTGGTLDSFKTIVQGIKKSLSELEEVKILSSQKLDIHSRLMNLANMQAMFDHPELESTYYNLSGDKVQTYMNPNVHSRFYKVVSNLLNINDLKNDVRLRNFKYLVTDSFSKGSEMLKRMFVENSGTKVNSEDDLLHPNLVNGIVNNISGKETPMSKVTRKQRLIIELNLNLNGRYLNLVPGDAALEGATTLHNAKSPFITAEQIYLKQHFEIFGRYLTDEINMSRENRIVAEGRNKKDLRFFKDILDEKTYNDIMKDAEEKYKTISENNLTGDEKNTVIESIYSDNTSKINSAIEKFFKEESNDMYSLLNKYGIVNIDGEEKYSLESIPLMKSKHLSKKELEDELYRLSLNYAIANVELHKLIYGDPYQYTMELKRTKLFGSPKQELLHDSAKINQVFGRIYNEGFTPDDIGWIDFDKEYFNTVTYNDILSKSDLLGYEKAWKETDGATFMNLKANKILKIRTNNWTDENELQYKHDIGYEKLVKGLLKENKSAEEIKKETDKYEKNNPDVASTYTPTKPSVAGNKDSGRNYNSTVIDKTANFVQSYRLLHQINPDSNALRLYNKMQDENIDYAVFQTSRKEGAEVVHNLYKDGVINNDPYTNTNEINNPDSPQGIVKIPFSIYGIAMEVPSKSLVKTSEGTQLRMLATMDMIEYGVPIDFVPKTNEKLNEWNSLSPEDRAKRSPLYAEIEHNREVLEAKMEQGVDTLFKKLGIVNTDDGFKINDVDKLVKTLKDEIFKYTINDNIIKSFKDFNNGTTLLEATPLYSQLRSIIYSIADKQVIHPKISGRQAVQAPATLFESNRIEVSKDKNGESIYHSGDLKFYTNEEGKRVCQIMVGRWFDSSLSDEQLLDYFKTEEGKKILSGIAFRIPTQNKNSIDAFEIAKFLPKEMRDQVVVPSAIVNKSGSDFDIDKLSVYLKNIFKDNQGSIKLVPFLGIGKEAKDEFGKRFDKGEFLEKHIYQQLQKEIEANREGTAPGFDFIKKLFGDAGVFTDDEVIQDFIESATKDGVREAMIDKLYTESLENEYIQSLENLTSHPMNFNKLISPNSAELLKGISDDRVAPQTGAMKSDYKSVGNLLKRTFMSTLRHGNIMGKQLIAIAAVNQKAHSIRQLVPTYIDTDRIGTDAINSKDGEWLGDGTLKFEKYNKELINGKERAIFAKLKDANNEHYISDINGQIIDGAVDIAKDDWIIRLGIKPNTVGTWLMLIDLGVPIKTVSYFMNQPIISDFLINLEATDKKWLFDSTLFQMIKKSYTPDKETEVSMIPSEGELFNMMKKDNVKTDIQKAQQQFILGEFLKYAKMAEHSFYVTQASNYDTASFNDPLLLDQKYWQLERAKNTIISSVDDLIDHSVIGKMKDLFTPVREALSNVLITDKINTRNTLFKTLHDYFRLDSKTFLKVSHKAVNDLIDWSMQNDTGINKYIKSILLGKDSKTSDVEDVIAYRDFVLKHPEHPLYNNTIINSIKLNSRSGEDSVDNLYIQGRDGKSYNQNLIIHGFEELKDELANGTKSEQTLYRRMLHAAVAQSGITVSPISFTSLLPYEDFKLVYNEAISSLENRNNLDNFNKVNAFQRINFRNSKIVPPVKAFTKLVDNYQNFVKVGKKIWNLDREYLPTVLKTAIAKGTLPMLIERATQSQYGDSDVILYSYQDNISAKNLIKARKADDYSYSHKILMKKVYNEDGTPYISTTIQKGIIYKKYLYKAINSWGDGIYANEMYDKLIPEDENSTIGQPSVLDNGIDKVQKKDANGNMITAEVEDSTILDILNNNEEKKDVLENRESSKLTPDEMNYLLNLEKNAPEGFPETKRPNEKCGG